MPITNADIAFYKALANNDTATNGGVISADEITSNLINNLFPNIQNAERIAGKTRYRKMFIRNLNVEELELRNTLIYIYAGSTAGDYFRLRAGTDADDQSDAIVYTGWKGAGLLETSVSAGAFSIKVTFDVADGVTNGDTLHLDDGSFTEDVVVNGVPSWVNSVATIALLTALQNNYTHTVTKVSACADLGELIASSDSWTETSVAGTYDQGTYPLEVFNIGTVSDSWELTFLTATTFSVAGNVTGSIGSGDTSSDFKPINGGSYYFNLDKDGWGGVWSVGETIEFDTVHAGASVWLKEVVPAGIPSYGNNIVEIGWKGESTIMTTTTTSTSTSTTTSTTSTSSTSTTQPPP